MFSIKNKINKIIDLSTIYLKTDVKHLLKGGFWLTIAKIVSAISSFLSSIVFANFVPKEIYGLYRLVLSYTNILSIPTLNGIDTSLTKAIGKGYNGSIFPAFYTKIKWGLLSSVASLFFAVYYYIWRNDISLSICFAIAAVFLPIMDPLQIFLAYLNGKQNYVTYTKYHTYIKVTVTSLLIVMILITQNLVLIILSYFLFYTLTRLLFFLITIKKIKNDNTVDHSIIPYGKHLSLMNILSTISIALDKILVFHYVGAIQLASYYLAMVPYKQVQNFVNSLNTLALPKFADNTIGNIKDTLPKKILKSYLIIIPIVIIYALTAPYLFNVFYPKYIDIVGISSIFMCQLIFTPIYLFNTALTAQGKKKELYIISISYAVVKIVLLIILVPMFGLYGAVASLIITSLFGAINNIVIFYKN